MDLTFEQLQAIERAKKLAIRRRVPKALRQYAKRYAKLSPEDVLAMHAKYRVPMLDHARDRAAAFRRKMGVA